VGWASLTGVVLTFLTALLAFLQSRRNTAKIHEVHVLVNSQLHDVLTRVSQLTETLHVAGVPVPDAPGHGEAGERLTPP
jgi:hypothetical protein